VSGGGAQTAVRVGIGTDIHRLVAGRPLVLGGVEVAHETGLEGHSDADVLTHALIDALLGAAALGDIGEHFPSGDERWRGARSLDLLARTMDLLGGAGYAAGNVDVTVVAERPVLAARIPEMVGRIADVLGVGRDRVSIKATTGKGLGPVGAGEAIAATAVALVVPAGGAGEQGTRSRGRPRGPSPVG
jgi:2-C-methyl-D-erythritol 2,4-cyclodiphosphate synthase